MTTIYGLREVGNKEVRYVGFSNKPLQLRLRRHQTNALGCGYPVAISEWIKSAGEIEIFAIFECPDGEAHNVERTVVERLHAEGHRLTNSHLLPRATAA